MDIVRNPYAPGAGSPPHELAGRESLLEAVRVALARIRKGRAAKSVMMVGLRGVGKTVLLNTMRQQARAAGNHTVRIEAPENRSLPSLLAPSLRLTLLELSRTEQAKDLAQRALRGLAGFVNAFKVRYSDLEVGIDLEPELGLADNGDLEHDLQELLEIIGHAAKAADTALALFIDEMQYVEEDQLAALITALHRCSQEQLPVTLVAAGLPQLPGRLGKAKSYAERLFDIQQVGPLSAQAARQAILNPAIEEGVVYEEEAVAMILEQTQGYPYFLQEWGNHSWNVADRSPITKADVVEATTTVIAALDESFFRVRFERLTPKEQDYLRAMAELGPGPHRSGDIASELQKDVNKVAPFRNNLVHKGMIWSPGHGDTAFTVPLFDQFMKRIMPGDDWRSKA